MEELKLEVQLEETVAMAQLGHLKHWAPTTQHIRLVVPPAMPKARVLDTMRLCGNCFPQLSHMHVVVQGAQWVVDQAIVAGAAELLGLRSLNIEGGCMEANTLQLHVLTSLKGLNSLMICGSQGGGVGDADILDNLAVLSHLTRLELRGDLDQLTDEGVMALSSLVSLRQLTVLPLGLVVSRQGLAAMFDGLPELQQFKAGFSCSQQVDVLQAVPDRVKSTGVVVSDSGADAPSLLTSCALCLGPALTSLKLHTVKVEDASFLLALGSLTGLQELSLTVAPARHATPAFMLNLAVLGQLKALQSMEMSVVGTKLLLPLTTKLASYLVESWPHLHTLALSCMVPPERLNPAATTPPTSSQPAIGRHASGSGIPSSSPASAAARLTSLSGSGVPTPQQPAGNWRGPLQPAALQTLQSFKELRRLVLTAPLPDDEAAESAAAAAVLDQDSSDDDNQVIGEGTTPTHMRRIPLPLTWLPSTLNELVLEKAELQVEPSQPAALQLAHLTSLALSQCKASDACLQALFSATPSLTRLELNEVHGISGAALQALATLNRLVHLEVVDSRARQQVGSTAPADPAEHPDTSRAAGSSWWGWLTGAGPAGQEEQQGKTGLSGRRRASCDGQALSRPRLQVTDITHLVHLSSLRHLQWAVGRPLLVPRELRRQAGADVSGQADAQDDSASDTSYSSDEDEAPHIMLGPQGTAAISHMKAVRSAVSQMRDLHELYLHTDPASVDAQVYQSQLSTWLGVNKPQDASSRKGRAGQADSSPRAPHWITSALPASCVVSGQLPIAQHDPWTDKLYLSTL